MAVTAAFSGADYLAKKQLAKYAAKQVTEKLGEELAERLLKDGADSTAIAKAVRSLEKSGADNALIRKAAGELTAAEFERIGSLAKRGLAGELLEKVVDNREVLGKASDSTLLLFKNSTGSCDDIITVLLKHGDEAGQLYGLYGDDVIDIALRYGDEGLAGGSMNGDPGSFTVDTAYLVNLIAASVDMAESLGMTELVLAVEEYKANLDNIFAYMSGDESAGDAIAVNAGINMAVTAAFSGANYLAKKQLAKYVAKQVTEKL